MKKKRFWVWWLQIDFGHL